MRLAKVCLSEPDASLRRGRRQSGYISNLITDYAAVRLRDVQDPRNSNHISGLWPYTVFNALDYVEPLVKRYIVCFFGPEDP